MQPASTHYRPAKAKLSGDALTILGLLLLIPGYALSRLAAVMDWRVMLAWPLAFSVFAFLAYRSDKRAAEAGRWRVPESTLHLIALLGGWPGAFLAQQVFRHKTSKRSFQFVFWSVVALHQYLAIDALLGWQSAREGWPWVRAQLV